MAKKTRTELSTLAINTNLPDNTTELITPTTERAQLTDERESVVNYKDDLGGTGNAGKFLTVATDGESLTMVDAPTGDVTGTGTQYQLAVWDGTSALTGYAALTYINSILQAPELRADSTNGTVTINATDASGGTAWLYFQNASVLKAEISYFIQDDFLTIRTYQKDIVFERAVNTPTLTIDGTTGDATFEGNVGIGAVSTDSTPSTLHIKGSQQQLTISEGTARGATFDYQSSTGSLQISTNGIDARTNPQITLSLSGNVGIGTDSPEKRLHIFDSTQTNQTLRFGNPSAVPFGEINYSSSGSEFLYIRAKGTTSGYGNIVFETGGTPSEAMRISSGGVVSIPNGIVFNNNTTGGTPNATGVTLNDYEEGTFTVILNSSGGDANVSPSNTTGYYVRVGNKVTVQYYSGVITIISGGTGVAKIGGLPYTSKTPVYHTLTMTHVNCFNSLAQNCFVIPGNDYLYATASNSSSNLVWGSSGTYFMFGGTYLI